MSRDAGGIQYPKGSRKHVNVATPDRVIRPGSRPKARRRSGQGRLPTYTLPSLKPSLQRAFWSMARLRRVRPRECQPVLASRPRQAQLVRRRNQGARERAEWLTRRNTIWRGSSTTIATDPRRLHVV